MADPLDILRLLIGAEQTKLVPEQELNFQSWAADNAPGFGEPDERYDSRGFWLENPTFRRGPGEHSTDKFKQHGHPTFSVESKYSKGYRDAGHWNEEDGMFYPPLVDSRFNRPIQDYHMSKPLDELKDVLMKRHK